MTVGSCSDLDKKDNFDSEFHCDTEVFLEVQGYLKSQATGWSNGHGNYDVTDSPSRDTTGGVCIVSESGRVPYFSGTGQ